MNTKFTSRSNFPFNSGINKREWRTSIEEMDMWDLAWETTYM